MWAGTLCLTLGRVKPLICVCFTAAPVTNQPVTPKALTAGQNKPHPSHIPSHFPEFPDPHTYIKTPVSENKDFYAIWGLFEVSDSTRCRFLAD